MRLSISFCNWVSSAWESILNISVSSAKRNIIFLLSTTSGRSFVYCTNKMGPRTLPLGMPLVTGADFGFTFFIRLHWVPSDRKYFIHPSILPFMPHFSVFRSSRLWGTLSKAFMKSQYVMSRLPPWSKISVQILRTCSNWSVVDRPVIKPNCLGLKRLLSVMCSIIWFRIILSNIFQTMHVRVTGL